MKQLFKRVPLPISGVILALFSFTNLFRQFDWHIAASVSFIIGSVFSLFYVGKLVFAPKQTIQDLKNPMVAAVAPTATMAIMIVLSMLERSQIVDAVWYAAIVVHFGLMIYFTRQFVMKKEFRIQMILPGWFVMYIGMAMMPLTASGRLPLFMDVVFYVCIVFALMLIPLNLYRMFVIGHVPEPAKPLIGIFMAPLSILLATYSAHFEVHSTVVLIVLLICSQLMFVCIVPQLFKLKELPFYPSFAALTFPFVITVTALVKSLALLNVHGVIAATWIVIETMIAIVAVAFVVTKYTQFLFQQVKQWRSEALNEI